MTVKLLTEHHLEFLSLKGGGTGTSESIVVKMSNCWKSHATADIREIPQQLLLWQALYTLAVLVARVILGEI